MIGTRVGDPLAGRRIKSRLMSRLSTVMCRCNLSGRPSCPSHVVGEGVDASGSAPTCTVRQPSPAGPYRPQVFTLCQPGCRTSWPSVRDWLPDQFGHVDHEVALLVGIARRAHLAHTHAHNIIEAAVAIAIAEVKDGANDLSPARWVC